VAAAAAENDFVRKSANTKIKTHTQMKNITKLYRLPLAFIACAWPLAIYADNPPQMGGTSSEMMAPTNQMNSMAPNNMDNTNPPQMGNTSPNSMDATNQTGNMMTPNNMNPAGSTQMGGSSPGMMPSTNQMDGMAPNNMDNTNPPQMGGTAPNSMMTTNQP
jgi:hypothetical protein